VLEMTTHAVLDTTVMETEIVLQMEFNLFALMDTSRNLMENVFFPQQFALLDMKVMEMEIASQYQ
jgi:hypothetical protein